MNKEVLRREGIWMADKLAKGHGLSILLGKCEVQKTIRTGQIEHDLEAVQNVMKECAYTMRQLVNAL